MNGKELNGKTIEVTKHEKKNQRGASSQKFTNLFIKNLPQGTDEK